MELCICLNNLTLTGKPLEGTTAPAVVQTSLPPYTKKGADHCGRRPFLLDAIKPSAYLLT